MSHFWASTPLILSPRVLVYEAPLAYLDLPSANVGSPDECGGSHEQPPPTHEATSSPRSSTPLEDGRPTNSKLVHALHGLWLLHLAFGRLRWVDQHSCVHKDTLDRCAIACGGMCGRKEQTNANRRFNGEKRTPKRLSLRKVVRIWCSLWGSAFLRYSAEATGKARTETRDGSLDQRVCLPRQQKKTCLGYASGRAVWAQSSTLIEIVAPCVCRLPFVPCTSRGLCKKRGRHMQAARARVSTLINRGGGRVFRRFGASVFRAFFPPFALQRRCGNHSWFFHVAPPEAKREGKRADCGGSLFSLSIRCAHVQCSSYEGLNRLLRSQTKMAECPAGPTQIDLHSRSLCYILRCESAGQRCVGADLHFFGSLVRPRAPSCGGLSDSSASAIQHELPQDRGH